MKTINLTLAILALTTITSVAKAQEVMLSAEKPFRIAIGTYNPMGSSIRQAMGATLPMLSLSYDAGKSTAEKPMVYGVYFDFAQNRHAGTNTSMTALGFSARYLSRAPLSKARSFVGAGIGSYNIKIGDSNSKVGGKLFGGYELNNGYYAEVAYHIINKVHGDDPSAAAISIGRRF